MTRPVAEQVVVITGATSGIGRATAAEFVHRGARVMAAARDEQDLQQLVDQLSGDADTAVALATDVTDYTQVQALADAAVQEFGRIDTWVNCAAVHEYAWFDDTTPDEFATVLTTNVMGQVHGVYAALPHLSRNPEGGVLIGLSSVEGVRAMPLQAPYVTSKFALRGFYDTLRMEARQRHPGVGVVTILPASIDTPIFEHARTRLQNLPMAPKPLYSAHVVARAIVHAARHPQREVPVGGSAAMFLLGQRFAPALMDRVLSRKAMMVDQQQTELPASGVDNLDHAAAPSTTGGPRLESSDKVHRVRQRSYVTEFVWQHPAARRAVAAAGTAGLGLLASVLVSRARNAAAYGRVRR